MSSFEHDQPGHMSELQDVQVLDDLEGEGMDESEEESDHGQDEEFGEDDYEDESIHCFEGHSDAVLAVAWSPTSADQVATGGQDDLAYLWRVGQDALEDSAGSLGTSELRGHKDTVVDMKFNSTGTLLATASMDGTIRVWSVPAGDLVRLLEGPGDEVLWIRWHPRGDIVVAGSADMTLWMWNAQTGACMQVFSGHQGPVSCGAFSSDGKAVVSGGGEDDCSLRMWNPRTGECTTTVHGHSFHSNPITCLAVHPGDMATVATGDQGGGLRVTNIHTGRVLGALSGHEEDHSVEVVGFSGNLPLAVSAGMDGKLLVWDNNTMSQRSCCQHPEGVTRLAWHPQHPLVFTGSLDGVARGWDLRTGQCVRTFRGHRDGIQDICISPDGSMILTGSDDGSARVFMTV